MIFVLFHFAICYVRSVHVIVNL
ncbi:hypothetical protein, partial [Plasmodium yoelii yoelii]